jgi:hypothetical protein
MPEAWEQSHRGKKPKNKSQKKQLNLKLNPSKTSVHPLNLKRQIFCNKDSIKQSDIILGLNNQKPSMKTTLVAFMNSLKISHSKP